MADGVGEVDVAGIDGLASAAGVEGVAGGGASTGADSGSGSEAGDGVDGENLPLWQEMNKKRIWIRVCKIYFFEYLIEGFYLESVIYWY